MLRHVPCNSFETESIQSTPNASERRRSMCAEPSPPSFSSAPPSDPMEIEAKDEAFARELQARERRESDANDKRQEQLAMLLTTAQDDAEANEILQEFQSEEGRERLITGTSDENAANNYGEENRRPRRTRGASIRAELADLIGSDEENQVIAESIRMNADRTDGVTTRRGTVLGKKRAREETRSVPLVRQNSSKDNFNNRDRARAINDAINKTRNFDKSPNELRRSTRLVRNSKQMSRRRLPARVARAANVEDSPQVLRRSSRIRRTGTSFRDSDTDDDDEEDREEEEDEDSDNMSTGSLRSNGSVGRSDGEVESNDEEKTSDIEDQLSNGTGSSTEEENNRRAGRRRSGRLNAPTKTAPKKKKKRNRKRRTHAKSVFDMEETAAYVLTEEERQKRLEALVRQSEEVAMKLNEAMAGEKERHDAKEKERTEANEKGQVQLNEGAVQTDAVVAASPARTLKKSVGEPIWPTGENKQMQPHQIDGVRWLLTLDSRGLNAILADEMGLGKTIQSIAFLATVSLGENRGPHLVIAPKNVVPHWAAEFENFYPKKFKVITHVGAGEERFERLHRNLRIHQDFDILVTSYELAMRDIFTKPKPDNQMAWQWRNVIRMLQKLEFEYAVVDEAHRLKNAESKFAIALRKYTQATRRLLLTGTPLSNSLQELWALMNVLNPRIFGSRSSFDEWFSAPFDTARRGLTLSEQSIVVDRLHTILRPFFRRRLRADICSSFASADEVVISCPQSALQKAISLHYAKSRTSKDMSANNTFQLLRQIANHPFTVCGALYEERELKQPSRLVSVSGKFLFLHYALPRLINGGHRVLIFSQFRKVLDFLEDLMDMLNLKYGRLDGETDNEGRDDIVTKFNAERSDIPVFLLTTRAGGVGLNLQTADTVILFDSDWNPSADLQAVSRIQRIGQKRTVHIMRLVTENSIDEAIVERGREKLRTEAVAVGAGKFGENQDPAVDAATRQQELAAILTKYERSSEHNVTFLDPNTMKDEDMNAENVTKEKLDAWNPQLLRVGEKSLPKREGDILPLTLAPTSVPEWLRPGANMRSATLALKCQFKWDVPDALQKGIEMERAKSGQLPSKRRRTQRFTTFITLDDSEQSSGDDFNETDQIESETSEDSFIPDSEVKKKKSSPNRSNIPNGLPRAGTQSIQPTVRPIHPAVHRAYVVQPGINAASSTGAALTTNSTSAVATSLGGNPTSGKRTIGATGGAVGASATAAPFGLTPNTKKFKSEPITSNTPKVTKAKRTPKTPKSEPKSKTPKAPKVSSSNTNHRPISSTHFPGGRKIETVIPFGDKQRTPVRRVLPVLQPRASQYNSSSPSRFGHSPPIRAGASISNSQSPTTVGQTNARGSSSSGVVRGSGSRRPQYRYVAPRPIARPFKQGEIIVIDSDDEKPQTPSPSKNGRQGTMAEMREKAARRKADMERAKSISSQAQAQAQ